VRIAEFALDNARTITDRRQYKKTYKNHLPTWVFVP